MMPRLDTTVIIPVANGERHIAECLTSVCSQFSHTDEIIVVVDRSTDGTLAVVNRFLPRVKILHSSGKGPSAARNLGITQARGRLIAFLDHDDLWPPSRHKALQTALENDDFVNTAAGRIRIAVEDHTGTVIRRSARPPRTGAAVELSVPTTADRTSGPVR